jgi:hypothetical protein
MKGFQFKDFYSGLSHQVYFMECKGKDISFPRWRFSLYYEPHLAMTHFVDSEEAYNQFIDSHKDECFSDYQDYVQSTRG